MRTRQDAKEPFVVSTAMRKLRTAVRRYPKAAMFELADEGFDSLFEQLIACIISIRTLEEVTLSAARNLFSRARNPKDMAALSAEEIDGLIRACTFHRPKAARIHAIASAVVTIHGGTMPESRDDLLTFSGVGPKCANLAIGVATGRPFGVPVDIHVHRVTNRWGIVKEATPERTMTQLERLLPKRYWLEINKLLVPFGKHICRAPRPRCPHCPLLSMCRQVGVKGVDPSPPPKSVEK